MYKTQLKERISVLAKVLESKDYMMATAESCTGGLLAKVATDQAGSSGWFSRGIVTYSNLSKHELLGVDLSVLENYGAVSQQTVDAMVNGLVKSDEVSIGVSISGIAGPDGGSADKPVGTVWVAWKLLDGDVISRCFLFAGDRETVRLQAAIEAANGLISLLNTDQ